VSAVLVIAQRDRLYLVAPDASRPLLFRGSPTDGAPSRPGADPRPDRLPVGLVEELKGWVGRAEIAAAGPALVAAISASLAVPVREPSVEEHRRARSLLPSGEVGAERAYLRELATEQVDRALRDPSEVLLTLAREEERLERAVGRERRAAEAFVTVADSVLSAYARRWVDARAALERHHASLVEELERSARVIVPNLSAVVGPRVAARLVAAAGGVEAAGRLRASRLQLLGSRRRPSPERGPRYGLLYRADRMDELPPHRRGAYARSLAALASIALRADSTTRAPIFAELVRRRDRRIDALKGVRR
jgi:snoRNA binding domain, fibrillarin